MEDLKEKAIRGGAFKLAGQLASMVLRLGSMMILARLLDPSDFGLVAMVTIVTGFLDIFATGGLSAATVQKAEVSDEQLTALFWINVLIGALLCALCLSIAPLLVVFYQESKTAWIMLAVAPAFLFNATAVQHMALLHRELRYGTLVAIEVLGQAVAAVVGIGMALAGFGYWSVVAASAGAPIVATIAAWFVVSWRPGPPRLGGDIAAMLRFGGTITLNTLVIYATYNLEKVLLGRYWGPDALGLYGRAYQLINLPTSALNAAIGGVAFSALSRLQHDPHRFRSYFIKGYALVVSLTLPTTLFAALFAADIICIALGPKWMDAVPIFQLLAPTILIFGIINPLAWLLQSVGLQQRSLKIALVLSPIVISAYLAGMPYGPTGIALAYSVALALWLVPHVLWCVHGTPVSATDLFQAAGRPLLAGVVAAAMAAAAHSLVAPMGSSLVNVMVAGATMALAYLFLLLFVFGQKAFYLDLLRGLKAAPVIRNEAGPVG